MAELSHNGDEVIVIVLDDDVDDVKQPLLEPSEIKTEPIIPEADDEQIQKLQEIIQQHGQFIKIEKIFENDGDDDDVYEPEEEVLESSEDEEPKCGPRRKIDPSKWVSYVREICNENPAYEKDKDALVHALVEEMRTVKPPTLYGVYDRTQNGNFACVICAVEKCTVGDVERHYLAQHGPRYLTCFACGADFRSTTNLYKHEKRCQAPDCKYVLEARAQFLSNKTRGRKYADSNDASVKRFQCDLCPASYVVKVSLMAHKRMHKAERPFHCEMCPKAYTSKSVLSKHRWTHSDANFVCDHCGRTFKYKTALASHIYTHFEPRFPCAECPKRFTYRAALLLHVHHKHRNLPPPCACQLCPKRFGRMWALKDHMRKAHRMILMTRRMFFKQLPQMSKTEIDQAKVVLRSEVPVLHPSDMTKRVKEDHEIELDFASGQLVKKKPGIVAKKKLKQKPDPKFPPLLNENNFELDPTSGEVTLKKEEDPECLKVVILDESEVDYGAISLQYRLGNYSKGRNIIVVENDAIKDLTDEEYKEIEEKIRT